MKKCTKCRQEKSFDNFYKRKRSKSGYRSQCKSCEHEKHLIWAKAHPESIKAKNLAYREANKDIIKDKKNTWYEANTEKAKAKSVAWKKANPNRHRSSRLKQRYGIMLEQYDAMLLAQNSCCAICQQHTSKLDKPLHVDHCHLTGKIRGLLCRKCNLALGNFEDNVDFLRSGIIYLDNFSNKQV